MGGITRMGSCRGASEHAAKGSCGKAAFESRGSGGSYLLDVGIQGAGCMYKLRRS